MTNNNWIEIGTIIAAQGLKGELRVYPDSDFPERFEKPGERWLMRENQPEPEAIKLLSGRYIANKGIYVIKLAGVDDRDRAEELRGCKLMVTASDRPTLAADEYHVLDLIGLNVFNQLTGEKVGIVEDIITAGNDLLVVNRQISRPNSENDTEKTKDKQILIPFVNAITPVVDLETGRIEITPPPGLLEL